MKLIVKLGMGVIIRQCFGVRDALFDNFTALFRILFVIRIDVGKKLSLQMGDF